MCDEQGTGVFAIMSLVPYSRIMAFSVRYGDVMNCVASCVRLAARCYCKWVAYAVGSMVMLVIGLREIDRVRFFFLPGVEEKVRCF